MAASAGDCGAASIEIAPAIRPEQIEQIRQLFVEYADSLDFSLGFQGFDQELATLPGDYAPPRGCLLLARHAQRAAGCVALRPFNLQTCEMKRLYVPPAFRGKGIGQMLVDRIIAEARRLGYASMRLDTIGSSMQRAIALYRQRGFQEIGPYRENPLHDAMYMELLLK